MTTTISTAHHLPVGTVVIIDGEWLRVTGEVDHLTYTVTRVAWVRQWRIRARTLVRRWQTVWLMRVWWPASDRATDAWKRRQRAL